MEGMKFFSDRYEALGGKIVPLALKDSIRVNTLKTSHEKLIHRLNKNGVILNEIPFVQNGYFVERSKFSLGAINEFLQGYYYIQEAAAQIPVEVLDPKPSEIILDACSAPGGKTTQIAQHMKNKGMVIALEKKPHRIISVKSNLERCGITNTVLFPADAREAHLSGMIFDKVLLDAPCSGNYVTDPSWFQKRTMEGINNSVQMQRELLKAVVAVTKKNGLIIYSTCSLEPEENELNMAWALKELPVKLEKIDLPIGDSGLTNVFGKELPKEISYCRRFWPHKTNTQGFFIAKLRTW